MNLIDFFKLLRCHQKGLILAISLMLLESSVSLSIPWFAGYFSNAIIETESIKASQYIQLLAIWLILFLTQAFLKYSTTFRINFIGAKILTQLSCRLYDRIQLLPLNYFNTTAKGKILALLSNDIQVISYFATGILTGLIPSVIILIGSLIMMGLINLTIMFLITLMVPLFFIILKLLGKNLKPISKQLIDQQATSIAIASENINAISLIKAFAREEIESDKFRDNALNIEQSRKKQLKLQSMLSPITSFLVSSGVLMIVFVCVMYYQSGELSLANIISLLMYGLLFARPMSALANLYGQTQQFLGSLHRLQDVFKVEPEPVFDVNSKTFPPFRGNITFNKVSFNFDNRKSIFNQLSVEFPAREINMVMGNNGTGKTSLLHLLMQFIHPSSGTISIGNEVLSEMSLSTIRRKIRLVSQDVTLCSGNIHDNIAFGDPQASRSQIEQAAMLAGAHQFILALPKGYSTEVGECGSLLSGGQRQKISLARAILTTPDILLLDEPTSMIDEQGIFAFKQLLLTITKTTTIIMVSHNQSLQSISNHCFTIDNGLIHENEKEPIANERS